MMFEALGQLNALASEGFAAGFLIFCRMAALIGLVPGFGERFIPMRVRLVAALAFTAMVWPYVAQDLPALPDTIAEFLPLTMLEVLIGAFLGLILRFLVMAVQLAGSIAAQSVSVSQIMGAGATPDPMSALSNLLTLGALVLLMAGDLPARLVLELAQSYQTLPVGKLLEPGGVAELGSAHVAVAFRLGFTLAIPFVLAALGYNIALGAINRAMPSLMVAFIGAPAITLGGLMLLGFAGPAMLVFWKSRAIEVIFNPLAMP